MNEKAICDRVKKAVVEGDEKAAQDAAQGALKKGISAEEITDRALMPAIIRVADLFYEEKISLPDVIAAAEAVNRALVVVAPHLPKKKEGDVIVDKKGVFAGQRIHCRMESLAQTLSLMAPTRYTWPPLLWAIPTRIKRCFHDCR